LDDRLYLCDVAAGVLREQFLPNHHDRKLIPAGERSEWNLAPLQAGSVARRRTRAEYVSINGKQIRI
jgi:hypothetical protein